MSQIADDLRNRTFRYSIRITELCRQLPLHWVDQEIGKQLLRAGMGVTGNYWSCCRARSSKEFIARLGIAVDEADESVLWLTMLVESGVKSDGATKALMREGSEVRAILAKSHKTAPDNRRAAARRRGITNSPIR